MSRIRQSIRELMQTIPGLIDAEMDSIDDLLRLRDARRKDLKELELSIEDTESKLQDYPPAYPYTDEPVQRFVIYGEDWAKKWITGAVEMPLAYPGRKGYSGRLHVRPSVGWSGVRGRGGNRGKPSRNTKDSHMRLQENAFLRLRSCLTQSMEI